MNLLFVIFCLLINFNYTIANEDKNPIKIIPPSPNSFKKKKSENNTNGNLSANNNNNENNNLGNDNNFNDKILNDNKNNLDKDNKEKSKDEEEKNDEMEKKINEDNTGDLKPSEKKIEIEKLLQNKDDSEIKFIYNSESLDKFYQGLKSGGNQNLNNDDTSTKNNSNNSYNDANNKGDDDENNLNLNETLNKEKNLKEDTSSDSNKISMDNKEDKKNVHSDSPNLSVNNVYNIKNLVSKELNDIDIQDLLNNENFQSFINILNNNDNNKQYDQKGNSLDNLLKNVSKIINKEKSNNQKGNGNQDEKKEEKKITDNNSNNNNKIINNNDNIYDDDDDDDNDYDDNDEVEDDSYDENKINKKNIKKSNENKEKPLSIQEFNKLNELKHKLENTLKNVGVDIEKLKQNIKKDKMFNNSNYLQNKDLFKKFILSLPTDSPIFDIPKNKNGNNNINGTHIVKNISDNKLITNKETLKKKKKNCNINLKGNSSCVNDNSQTKEIGLFNDLINKLPEDPIEVIDENDDTLLPNISEEDEIDEIYDKDSYDNNNLSNDNDDKEKSDSNENSLNEEKNNENKKKTTYFPPSITHKDFLTHNKKPYYKVNEKKNFNLNLGKINKQSSMHPKSKSTNESSINIQDIRNDLKKFTGNEKIVNTVMNKYFKSIENKKKNNNYTKNDVNNKKTNDTSLKKEVSYDNLTEEEIKQLSLPDQSFFNISPYLTEEKDFSVNETASVMNEQLKNYLESYGNYHISYDPKNIDILKQKRMENKEDEDKDDDFYEIYKQIKYSYEGIPTNFNHYAPQLVGDKYVYVSAYDPKENLINYLKKKNIKIKKKNIKNNNCREDFLCNSNSAKEKNLNKSFKNDDTYDKSNMDDIYNLKKKKKY